MGEAKEIVSVRFKRLKDGGRSIYFDIYQDGRRTYLFQKERLLPDVDEKSRATNASILEIVENRRQYLTSELILDKSEIPDRSFNTDMKLLDWMDRHFKVVMRTATYSYIGSFKRTRKLIDEYSPGVLLRNVDEGFVSGLYRFIVAHPQERNPEKTIAHSCAHLYLKLLSAHLNAAIRERLIDINPCPPLLSVLHRSVAHRTDIHALTQDELNRLIDAPCGNGAVKRLFLFTCFTGLLPVELSNVQWRHLYKKDGRKWLAITQKRTGRQIELPLNSMAAACVPPRRRAKGTTAIFDIHSPLCRRGHLLHWAESAKIDFSLNFRIARDTFASLLLSVGTDFYTASYLMGFTSMENMIEYEGMVNEKRRDVVERIDQALR